MAEESSKGWLEDFEDRLLRELDETTDPKKAVKIIETLCTGRTEITNDGFDHKNYIPKELIKRIITSPSPAFSDYKSRLARWGEEPNANPPLPPFEWLMEMIKESE